MHVCQEVVLHLHYYDPIPSDEFDETHDYALIKIFNTSKEGPFNKTQQRSHGTR